MKTMRLTNSDKVALVDDEDFDRCDKFRWRLVSKGYVGNSFDSGKSYVFLHNFVMCCPNGSGIGHINRNKLDNQKANFRKTSNSIQGQNRGTNRNNSSGFKGVTFHRGHGRWQASIKVNYTAKHLGYFDTPEQAARVYDIAAVSVFGPNAATNF